MTRSGEIDWTVLDELEASVRTCSHVNPLTVSVTLSIVKRLRESVLHIDPKFIDVVGEEITLHTSEAQFSPLLAELKEVGLFGKVKIVVD